MLFYVTFMIFSYAYYESNLGASMLPCEISSSTIFLLNCLQINRLIYCRDKPCLVSTKKININEKTAAILSIAAAIYISISLQIRNYILSFAANMKFIPGAVNPEE